MGFPPQYFTVLFALPRRVGTLQLVVWQCQPCKPFTGAYAAQPCGLDGMMQLITVSFFHACYRRIVGYCAHWRESLVDPDTKIIRPQQVGYTLYCNYSLA